MNLTKRFSIYLLIALLTIVNINYYRSNSIQVPSGQTGWGNVSGDQIEIQKSPLFSVIEQRGNPQVQFGNLHKNYFKISLPNLSMDKVSFVIKSICTETCYSFLCQIIVPGLEKPDIIFPFQYFW